jgi:hypothetical protein
MRLLLNTSSQNTSANKALKARVWEGGGKEVQSLLEGARTGWEARDGRNLFLLILNLGLFDSYPQIPNRHWNVNYEGIQHLFSVKG